LWAAWIGTKNVHQTSESLVSIECWMGNPHGRVDQSKTRRKLQENSVKKTGVKDKLSCMPKLTLSTGLRLLSEHVERVEYYPRGSLRSDDLLNVLLSGHDAAPATREQDFLYVRTVNGAAHVRGSGAAQDATTLEEAGVRVNRRPLATTLSDF
jgi:hypothetical protein